MAELDKSKVLKSNILNLVKEYYNEKFYPIRNKSKNKIPFSERVFDEKELVNLVDSSLDFWLTAGRYSMNFEYKFAQFMDVEHCLLVNSGSSANLVAFTTLTSPKLGNRRLKKGEEVITVAAGDRKSVV
jgi:CDP-6-deoxy-D-xylo-4-hexulose-3-dehydrase